MADEPMAAEEILDGVYRALCANGYAALTMQDIADECDKSKSLLHYHYDTKEDLLVAFLEKIITDYEERLGEEAELPPVERLGGFIARFVFPPEDNERASFHLALLEMRSQGPFNERIREKLTDSDDVLRGTVADILHDGIDAGVFEDVDVDRTAALLVATLDGARTRQVTLREPPVGEETYTQTVAQETIRRIVEPLLADDVSMPPLDEMIDRVEHGRRRETTDAQSS
jgi:AcrR family transcriptional regulator